MTVLPETIPAFAASETDESVLARTLRRARERLRGGGQGLLSVVDQGVVSGTSFATSVLIGRMCSPEELGVYFLALSILLFLRAVQSDIILSPYMVYSPRRQGERLALYTGSSLLHLAVFVAAAVLGLLALVAVLSLGSGFSGLSAALCALLVAMPFLLLREYIRNLSFSQLRMGTALVVDLLIAAFQIGGLVLLWQWNRLTVEFAYLVMGLGCGLACCGWAVARRQPVRFSRTAAAADWRQNWSFARWALAGQLLNRAAGYVLPWVIAALHGETATGILAACMTIVNFAATFIAGVGNYLTPRAAHAFARGGVEQLQQVLRGAALLFLLTIGPFCVLLLFAGNAIGTFVYGAEFADLGPILAILACGVLANSLGLTVGNGLWAIDLPRANFAADVWVFGVTFVGLLILVAPLGVRGAALALLAGAIAGAAVRARALQRLLREQRRIA